MKRNNSKFHVTWAPKENHHTVVTFTQAFRNDLLKEDESIKQIPLKNLSKQEEDAFQNLCNRDDIIITKADKGGAVVIVDTIDLIDINQITVNRTFNKLKPSHLLDERIAIDLLSLEAKTPQFQMLPKVHKKGNPGRKWSVQLIAILQRFQNTFCARR